MGLHFRRLGALAAFACTFAGGLFLATAHAGRSHPSAQVVERSLLAADFEQSPQGWRTHHAVILRARKGVRGFGARVLPRPMRVRQFWIYADPRPVQASARNADYEATAKVRSLGRGQPVCLKLREVAEQRVVGTARRCVWAVGGWRVIRVTYTARSEASQVGLSVRAFRRLGFAVDRVQLTERRFRGRPC